MMSRRFYINLTMVITQTIFLSSNAISAINLAGKVHLIAIGETNDLQTGEIAEDAVRSVELQLSIMSHRDLSAPKILTGKNCNPAKIEETFKQVSSILNPNDTLVVYCVGQAALDNRLGPVLMINDAGKQHCIPRTELARKVKSLVQSNQIRLGVFITDNVNRQKQVSLPNAYPSTVCVFPREYKSQLWNSLFMESEGFVDVDSAIIGEEAVAYPNYKHEGGVISDGALFTTVLTDLLSFYEGERLSWDTFLGKMVANAVREEFRKNYPNGIELPDGKSQQRTQTIAIHSIAKLRGELEDQNTNEIPSLLATSFPKGIERFHISKKPPYFLMSDTNMAIGNVSGSAVAKVPNRLGVRPESLIYTVQAPFRIVNAVRVASIVPGSPASNGMLDPGDIILEINGIPTPTLEAFHKAIEQAGDVIQALGYNVRTEKVEKFRPIPINPR